MQVHIKGNAYKYLSQGVHILLEVVIQPCVGKQRIAFNPSLHLGLNSPLPACSTVISGKKKVMESFLRLLHTFFTKNVNAPAKTRNLAGSGSQCVDWASARSICGIKNCYQKLGRWKKGLKIKWKFSTQIPDTNTQSPNLPYSKGVGSIHQTSPIPKE